MFSSIVVGWIVQRRNQGTAHWITLAATPQLLDALSPSFAIISVAATARGTTPSDDTLTRLSDAGAIVYRTDENGTIRLTSDGAQMWVETEK